MPVFFEPESTNAEEAAVAALAAAGDPEAIAAFIGQRLAAHGPRWATKFPIASIRAGNDTRIRDAWAANWLVMVRDPVASAVREAIIRPGLCVRQGAYQRCAELINVLSSAAVLAETHGVLITSFEKLQVQPASTLAEVWRWMGSPADAESLSAGADQVRPADPRYFAAFDSVEKPCR